MILLQAVDEVMTQYIDRPAATEEVLLQDAPLMSRPVNAGWQLDAWVPYCVNLALGCIPCRAGDLREQAAAVDFIKT